MKAKLHYQKILEWSKTAIEQLPKELQEKIKALDLNYQLQDKDNSEHRIKIVTSGDKEVSSDILEFLQEENPAKQIISFEESLKIIALWEKEGVTSEEPEESLNFLDKNSTKEMLELCMDVAKNYFTLKNGFYKSPTKKFVICKMDLAAENINTPARIGNTTKILELSDKLNDKTYSEILYMLVWCFCKMDGVVIYEQSDIRPINILKDVEGFSLKEVFKELVKILPHSDMNTERLECMFEELKKLKTVTEDWDDIIEECYQEKNTCVGQQWDIVHGFEITNHDKVPRKAIIGVFGYSNKVNYGSESGIEIKSKDGKEFGQFLKEIAAADDFKVEAIDIHCKNKDQLSSVLTKRVAEVAGVKGEIKHIFPEIEGDNAWYECNYTHSNVESLEIVVQPNTTLNLNIVNNVREIKEEKIKEDLGVVMGNHYKSDTIDINNIDDKPEEEIDNYNKVNPTLFSAISMSEKVHQLPFVIKVENTTEKTLNANLFGFNEVYDKESNNWGNPDGIKISSGWYFVSYKDILLSSCLKSFNTALIVLKSKNKDQIQQIISISSVSDKGQSMIIPLITTNYYKNYPSQIPCNEVDFLIRQDAFTKWEIPILPKTELEIMIFHYVDGVDVDPSKSLLENLVVSNKSETKDNYILNEVEELKTKIELLEKKKWWHFFFPPKK